MRSGSPVILVVLVIGISAGMIRPALADVTVTMRGSFVTSPGFHVSPSLVQWMTLLLNPTVSYKGRSGRYETGSLMILDRQQDRRVFVYDSSSQRFAVLKVYDLSLADSIRRSFSPRNNPGILHVKLDHVSTLMFDHHRCRRYRIVVSIF